MFPLKVVHVVLVLTSFVNLSYNKGDKGGLHCVQLESFIVAEDGRCGLWWWEDMVCTNNYSWMCERTLCCKVLQ